MDLLLVPDHSHLAFKEGSHKEFISPSRLGLADGPLHQRRRMDADGGGLLPLDRGMTALHLQAVQEPETDVDVDTGARRAACYGTYLPQLQHTSSKPVIAQAHSHHPVNPVVVEQEYVDVHRYAGNIKHRNQRFLANLHQKCCPSTVPPSHHHHHPTKKVLLQICLRA